MENVDHILCKGHIQAKEKHRIFANGVGKPCDGLKRHKMPGDPGAAPSTRQTWVGEAQSGSGAVALATWRAQLCWHIQAISLDLRQQITPRLAMDTALVSQM